MNADASEPQGDDMLERYLDHLLDEPQRRAFLERLAGDERLRAEVQRQQQLDASLRRLFDGASCDLSKERLIKPHLLPRERRPEGRRRTRIVAACTVIVFLVLLRIWISPPPPSVEPYTVREWKSMETVYQDVAATNFRGTSIGRTDERLSALIERRFRQPLTVRRPSGPVTPKGLGFCNTITKNTACLIAEVSLGSEGASRSGRKDDAVGVLVFMDNAEADATEALPKDPSLHVFTKTVGRLALYEVTPLPYPTVLDMLQAPDETAP